MEVAHHAGSAGEQLAAAARDAFMSGSRAAMAIGAALLIGGAVYVALRGDRADAKAPAPAEKPRGLTSPGVHALVPVHDSHARPDRRSASG